MAFGSIDDFRWLVSADASPYLERAAAESAELVRLAQSLRRQLSAERTHWILEQVTLRPHAQDKFHRANQMFFTRTLLEQATDERIAVYKARRFPADQPVVDLCCGLGGDMIGLGQRGPVQGVDHDPIAAVLAEANNAVYGQVGSTLRVADVAEIAHEETGLWHIDPDRRPAGQRTTHVELFQPSLDVLERLRRRQPNGAIKLAAATLVPDFWLAETEREWIGSRRECRQQVAWFGALARCPALRRATVVGSHGDPCSVTGQPDTDLDRTSPIRRFLFEPHAAVLAAQLTGSLAAKHQLSLIAHGIAYLTGDEPVASPLLAVFDVLEVLPFDLRQLRAALAARHIGRLEIKARGVDVDPASLRNQLKPRGDEEMTLLIAGPPSNIRAILAKRWSSPPGPRIEISFPSV